MGKSGAHTGHRACGRAALVKPGPGVVPRLAMKERGRPTTSVAGREPRPVRGWWPLRSWSCFRFMTEGNGGAAVLRAVTEVELEPEVAGLQVGALRGPEAVNRGRAGRQDVALLGGRG